MNTFNLLNAIALLACISTPAYVIYYLKYFIREKMNILEENLNDVDLEIANHDSHIAEINFERKKELHDINNLMENVESQLKSVNNKTSNTFEQLHVDMNYVKRTLNDDMSKVNERIDLTNDLHKNTIDKIQEKVSKKNDIQWVSQHHFNSERLNELKHIFKQLDSLQSLNITIQSILTRINSTEFAREVMLEFLKKDEVKLEFRKKEKKKAEKVENEEIITSTKPTESVKSEVVNMIKEDVNIVKEQPTLTPTPITTSPVDEIVEKKPRKTKKDSKRAIRNRELEIFFKEQTKLTYRGFVIKFGEEAFKREKELVYKRLYYYKFVKPKQQNDYIQSELAFKTKQ
jgi:hypothetical protein